MKTIFSCFKYGECITSISTTTKQVLTFVKTVLTSTILSVNFYTQQKSKHDYYKRITFDY